MALPPLLFEDDLLLAFDKPSGMLVAPDRWDKERPYLMREAKEKLGPHVANVHRLDADTSGVLLCAKSKEALDSLSGQFQSKTVAKRYLALVAASVPEPFTVDKPIKPDDARPGLMCTVKKHGKASLTEFQPLERFAGYTLLECRPLTGRTHQIRVHLAFAGMPILYDPFYGDGRELKLSSLKRGYKGRSDEKPLLGRLALHAASLTVRHPGTREPLTLTAPLPKEFEVALKYLRKFAAL